MKKYFIPGLATLLPLALTLAVIIFIVNLLTAPFQEIVNGLMVHYQLYPTGFSYGMQLQWIISKLIILVFLFFITVGIGFLTRWMLIHYLIRLGDRVIQRIPLIRVLYKTFQEISHTLFNNRMTLFKKVVLVPYPHKDAWTIGFVSSEDVSNFTKSEKVAVFIPTTPNPTAGFLLFFSPNELQVLDLSVENALKIVISCGVITSPIQP